MKGKWISCGDCDAPWIQGTFQLEKTDTLSIRICGLGFFELYINKRKVSEDLLVPVWSDYSSRAGQRLKYPINDERSYRTYYCQYDIDEYVQEGKNTIEVLLGNGWYNQRERMAEGEMWYGTPKLWFEIFEDKAPSQILYSSNLDMKWRESHIVFNNVYFGEKQDLCMTDNVWHPVELTEAPEGELCKQECPPDRVIREIIPTCIGEIDHRKIYDVGENITGWVVFTDNSACGQEIILRFAELLDEDGDLDFESTGKLKQIQSDSFISAGKKEFCTPHFTWHGFRYFDVAGEVTDLRVQVIHSDVTVTGSFRCSNDVMNWMVDAYTRSRLGNMHCGVPSDCPHRERLGYTGDTQAVCGTDFSMLDADKFYRKWIQDLADGQCKKSGHVQHTAPFYGGGGGPGGWGGAMVLVPWEHYRRYGDKELLKKYYPNMLKYISYMYSRRDERGLVVREEEKGWCLGEWCTPEPVVLEATFVNTYYLAKCLLIIKEISDILEIECADIEVKSKETLAAIEQAFYDKETNHYAGGIQGADVFALDIGLGNKEMASAMAAGYEETKSFDTGFLGTGVLIRQLFSHGFGETAVKLLQSHAPEHSYGWQMEQGATTLWERWNGYESHNHPMFGSPVQMFFEAILGIKADKDTLTIAPFFSKQLAWAEGKKETKFGPVSIKWEWTGEKITIHYSLPCNAELLVNDKRCSLEKGEGKFTLSMEEDNK